MSIALTLNKAYFLANLFLALGPLLLWMGQKSTTGVGSNVRQLHWLRLSQALLGLLLVAGLLAPSIPRANRASRWLSLPQNLQVVDLDGAVGGQRVKALNVPSLSNATFTIETVQESPAPWPLFVLFAVAAGIAFALGRVWVAIHGLSRLLSEATPLRRIGRVRLLLSEQTRIPFATRGLRSAYVVLPLEILDSRKDFSIALSHELQHHRQGDTWWVHAMELLKIVCFWNPAVYLWASRLSEQQELACDEALLTRRKVRAYDYGDCLLRVAAAQGARKNGFGMAGMSCGGSGPKSLLRRRIQMLISHSDKSSGLKLASLITFYGVTLVTLGVTASTVFGRSPEKTSNNNARPAVMPEIQSITEKAVAEGLTRTHAQAAFAVVADSDTGKILAVAHAMNDHGQAKIDTTTSPFLSQPVIPWSVGKTVVVGKALDAGKTRPDELQDCENGTYKVGRVTYHDWAPFHLLSTADVLAHSSNIGVIKIAQKLGGRAMARALPDFGFGPGGSASLYPGAPVGWVPTPESLPDDELAASLAIGMSYGPTPIELVEAYAAIANGGNLMAAQPADASSPILLHRVISSAAAAEMREMLQGVVLRGTGKPAAIDDYSTAGKTGTGRKESEVQPANQVAVFAGFAPVGHPRLTAYVAVENPAGGAHGGEHAGPIFGQIMEAGLRALNVPPDLRR